MKTSINMKASVVALALAVTISSVAVPLQQAEAGVLMMSGIQSVRGKINAKNTKEAGDEQDVKAQRHQKSAKMLLNSLVWTGGYAVTGALVSWVIPIATSGAIMAVFFGAVALDNEGRPNINELESRYAEIYPSIDNQGLISDLAAATYEKYESAETVAEGVKLIRFSPAEATQYLSDAGLSSENPEYTKIFAHLTN